MTDPEILWYKNKALINTRNNSRINIIDDGVPTLIINESTMEDNGKYKCSAINRFGSAEKLFNVIIIGKTSTT